MYTDLQTYKVVLVAAFCIKKSSGKSNQGNNPPEYTLKMSIKIAIYVTEKLHFNESIA